jgi:serine/threonine-protein kinase
MMKELLPNTNISHYRIVSKLGAGGMGEVYLAVDNRLDRKVALKILSADLATNQDRMRRFTQEAKAAAALNHPNIAHIYEIDEHEGASFIAMEFVDGKTLRERIHKEKCDLSTLVRDLFQVAGGLAKAHDAGIVHRDLKPDNIMITSDGHAKILDFGLAKLSEPSLSATGSEDATQKVLTNPGVVMGTVGYMSPEQAKAKPIDSRSDVFSFGCLLYEAATGHKPFAGESTIDTLYKIIHDAAPAITDYNPTAPTELQRIIRKCLAKEPEKRYQSIRDTANDLEDLIAELKAMGDVDRSVAPSSYSSVSISNVTGSAAAVAQASSTTSSGQSASNAEYIVTGISRHKLAAALVVVMLLGGAALFSYYLYTRNSKATITSIAVLPFQNRSSDTDTEYLSDGLAESLIYRLSQLPNLKVSPTSAIMRYKGKEVDPQKIAAELNVDAVMSGRVGQRGDSLTISVELVDARNNKLLWGEQYERKMTDLLATQREIATMIADKLQVKLSGTDNKGITKHYTESNEAYQLYLKGRFYWNKRTGDGIKKAIDLLTAATEKDPSFALAYAGLADCYTILSNYTGGRPAETMPRAKAFAQKAIELDGTLAEPHAALAMVTWNFEWDRQGAEREYKRSIELNPNYPTAHHWYSRFLRAVGRQDEALAEINRAVELDSLSPIFVGNIAEIYLDRGDLKSASTYGDKMLELDPGFWSAHAVLATVLVKQGRNADALAEAQTAIRLSNRSSAALALLGYVYARSGQKAEAQSIAKELEKRFAEKMADGRDLALVYAGLDDKDKAFQWLESAFQYRSSQIANLRLEALLGERLSNDPRWSDLFRRTGIS